MLRLLAERRSLWVAFVLTILMTFAFTVIASLWGLTFIDGISDPSQVREVIAGMTSDQRVAHAWTTATLDVAYPLAYGALFVGSAYAFYRRFGRYIAMILLVVIPVDLLEGVVQVLALTESADLVDAKAVLTPLKSGLFLLGAVFMLFGWAMWVVNRFRARQP